MTEGAQGLRVEGRSEPRPQSHREPTSGSLFSESPRRRQPTGRSVQDTLGQLPRAPVPAGRGSSPDAELGPWTVGWQAPFRNGLCPQTRTRRLYRGLRNDGRSSHVANAGHGRETGKRCLTLICAQHSVWPWGGQRAALMFCPAPQGKPRVAVGPGWGAGGNTPGQVAMLLTGTPRGSTRWVPGTRPTEPAPTSPPCSLTVVPFRSPESVDLGIFS